MRRTLCACTPMHVHPMHLHPTHRSRSQTLDRHFWIELLDGSHLDPGQWVAPKGNGADERICTVRGCQIGACAGRCISLSAQVVLDAFMIFNGRNTIAITANAAVMITAVITGSNTAVTCGNQVSDVC